MGRTISTEELFGVELTQPRRKVFTSDELFGEDLPPPREDWDTFRNEPARPSTIEERDVILDDSPPISPSARLPAITSRFTRKALDPFVPDRPERVTDVLETAAAPFNPKTISTPTSRRVAGDLGASLADMAEGGGGVMSWWGRKLDSPWTVRIGDAISRKSAEISQDLTPPDPNFIDSIVRGYGSAVAFYVPGVVVAGGAKALGVVAPRLAKWLGITASAALESMVESGTVYNELLARGTTPEEASKSATTTFWANMPVNAILNRFGLFSDDLGRGIAGFFKSNTPEAMQEITQQMISNFALNDPIFRGAFESGAVGFLTSAGIKGIQRVAGGATPSQSPQRDPEIQRLIANDSAKYDEQAQKAAAKEVRTRAKEAEAAKVEPPKMGEGWTTESEVMEGEIFASYKDKVGLIQTERDGQISFDLYDEDKLLGSYADIGKAKVAAERYVDEKPVKEAKPETILDFARKYKVNPNMVESSDILELDEPKFVDRKGGRSLDDVTLNAIESGFLPEGSTGSDYLEALRNAQGGRQTYRKGEEPELEKPIDRMRDDEIDQAIIGFQEKLGSGKLLKADQMKLAELVQEKARRAEFKKKQPPSVEEKPEFVKKTFTTEELAAEDEGFAEFSKAVDEVIKESEGEALTLESPEEIKRRAKKADIEQFVAPGMPEAKMPAKAMEPKKAQADYNRLLEEFTPVDEGETLFSVQPKSAEAAREVLRKNKIDDKVMVEMVDQIERDDEAFREGRGREFKEGEEEIVGVTRTYGKGEKLEAVIQLTQKATPTTGRHEAFHAVTNMLLTEREKGVILKKYGDYEKAADAFGEFRDGKTTGDTVIDRIFQAIKDFLERVGNYLESKGFKSADDVFRAIDEGKLGDRAKGEMRRTTEYSVKQTESEAFKKWFGNSKVVDENGAPKIVYRGDFRADLIKGRFQKNKTTSGRFYFTEDPEVASSYSTGKEYNKTVDYNDWFLVGDGKRKLRLDRAWFHLTDEQRQRVRKVITEAGRADNYVSGEYDETIEEGKIVYPGERGYIGPIGGIEHVNYTIRDNHGNLLSALRDLWLDSGTLYDQEEKFGELLDKAGLTYQFVDPHFARSGVFPVYLSIQNPINAFSPPKDFVDAVQQWGKYSRKKATEHGADLWDKNMREPQNYAQELADNAAKGDNLWTTSIPDPVVKIAQRLGYDGIEDKGGKYQGKENVQWIAFEPTQIKSAIGNRGTFDPTDARIQYSVKPRAETFFSGLQKLLEEKMPERAFVPQVRSIIRNAKIEEVNWSGINEYLEGKTHVSKKDLLEFLKANQVQVHEVVKGKPDARTQENADLAKEAFENYSIELAKKYDLNPRLNLAMYKTLKGMTDAEVKKYERLQENYINWRDRSKIGTKFESYQLPGGENYRELLLTLPTVEDYHSYRDSLIAKYKTDATSLRDHTTADEKAKLKRLADKEGQLFRSSHFDEPNILAHVRFNERVDSDGKKVLFIEELQSDWHQKGREEGYQKGEEYPDAYVDSYKQEMADRTKKPISEITNEQVIDYFGLKPLRSGVPDAPFKKTWHEMALKRMLRYAAENGFDRLSWTTGDQQAERYDLSKQIDAIRYSKQGEDTYWLKIIKDGKDITPPQMEVGMGKADLEKYVGKEVAAKISNGEGKNQYIGDEEETHKYKELSGLDLKVGGEGMRGFYDQMIPIFLNKYAKKWGSGVGTTELDIHDFSGSQEDFEKGEGSIYTKVHSIDITDSMRRDVLEVGQPQYAVKPKDEGGEGKASQGQIAKAQILRRGLKISDTDWEALKWKETRKRSMTEMNKFEAARLISTLDKIKKEKLKLSDYLADKPQKMRGGEVGVSDRLTDTEIFFNASKPFPQVEFPITHGERRGGMVQFYDWMGGRGRGTILKDAKEAGKAFVDEIVQARELPSYKAAKYNNALSRIEEKVKLNQDEIFNLKESLEGREKPANEKVQTYFNEIDRQRKEIQALRQKQIDDDPFQLPLEIKRKQSELWGLKHYFHHHIPATSHLEKGGKMRNEIVADMARRKAVASVKEAEEMLDEYVNYVRHKITPLKILTYLVETRQAANIEDAALKLSRARQFSKKFTEGAFEPREIDLPFYDPNPLRVVPKYNESAMRHLYMVDRFGPNSERLTALIQKIEAMGGNKEIANTMLDHLLGRRQEGEEARAIGTVLRDIQTIEKLSYAMIPNFFQGFLGVSLTMNPLLAMKTKIKVRFHAKEAIDWARQVGQNPDLALLFYEDPGSWSRRFLAFTGFRKTEQGNYIYGTTAGKLGAIHYFNKLKRNPKNAVARRKLQMLGVDIEEALKNGVLSELDLIRAGDRAWRESQAIPDITNLPQRWLGISTENSAGRLMFQFKTVAYNQTRIVRDHFVKEVIKGNPIPLLTMGVIFPAVGEIIMAIKSLLQGRDRPEEFWKRYMEDLSSAFAWGILNDVYWWGKLGYLSVGPAFSQMGELMGAAYEIFPGRRTEKKDGTMGKRQWTYTKKQARNIPFFGQAIYNKYLKNQPEPKTAKPENPFKRKRNEFRMKYENVVNE